MKCLKLEEYVSILQMLLSAGPKKTSELGKLLQLEEKELLCVLSFLLDKRIIKADHSSKKPTYAAANSSVKIVNFFGLNP